MAQWHAAVIDQAGLVDGVADHRLVGLGEHVVIAEDVLIVGGVLHQGAERAATTVGNVWVAGVVQVGVVVVVIASRRSEGNGSALQRLVCRGAAVESVVIEQNLQR